MSKENPGVIFDASNSWNGYNHQGKLAILFAIKQILEVYDKTLSVDENKHMLEEYFVEIEYLEDFSIGRQVNGGKEEYFYVHQVKNHVSEIASDYNSALLGLAYHIAKMPTLKKAYLHTTTEIDFKGESIDGEIKSKKARLIEVNSKTEKNTEYAPLLDGKQVWDMETISFGESNPEKLLLQYNSELEKIEKYVQYADTHTMYFAFRKFMNIPENIRNSAMKALILLQKNPMSVDDIESAYQNQKFIQQQKEEINLQEYLKVDVQKICNILDIEANKELIDEIPI